MQKRWVLICLILMSVITAVSCTNPRIKRIDTRTAFVEYHPGQSGYIKRVAIVPGDRGRFAVDAQLEDEYFQDMVNALEERVGRSTLLVPGNAGFPDYARAWADKKPATLISEIAARARSDGFNALVSTSVTDIRVWKRKSGIWFWRSTKYILTVVVNLDILDSITGAKVVSLSRETKMNSNKDAFDAVQAGQWHVVAPIPGLLDELASKIAAQAANGLQMLPWQTTVEQADHDRIELAAGRRHGLSVGDHLVIFEGRQIVGGNEGQTYIAPGFKIGEVRISAVDDSTAQAQVVSGSGIQIGDIAVPVGS